MYAGKFIERDDDPIERADVASESLQPSPPEHVFEGLALDRVKKWNEGHPRQQADIEFRERQRERESTGDYQRRAGQGVRGNAHRFSKISPSGITPAHGGWPLKRS